jgi:hypothetical protein
VRAETLRSVQGLEKTAVERVKAVLLERISGLKPGSGSGVNNAAIYRQGLLAFKAYPPFLRKHNTPAYLSVVQRYCEDNRGYLHLTVRTYMSGLMAALQCKEKSQLVSSADTAAGGLNKRLGHIFLPSALPPLPCAITCAPTRSYLCSLHPVCAQGIDVALQRRCNVHSASKRIVTGRFWRRCCWR